MSLQTIMHDEPGMIVGGTVNSVSEQRQQKGLSTNCGYLSAMQQGWVLFIQFGFILGTMLECINGGQIRLTGCQGGRVCGKIEMQTKESLG